MDGKKVYIGQTCYLLKCVTQNYNSKSWWEPDLFILTDETWLPTQIYLSNRQQTEYVKSAFPPPVILIYFAVTNRWYNTEASGSIPGGPSDTGTASRRVS